MKIAIPEYNGRVSPVFDTSQRLLVFRVDHGGVGAPLGNEDWSYLPLPVRATRLRQMGVDVLLCGGISGWLARQIEALGIRLVPWLAGDVQQVLEAFVAGRLPDRYFAMPGTWGMRRGRRLRRMGRPYRKRILHRDE